MAPSWAVLTAGVGMYGIFLFLIYYMQQTLGYSAVVSGVAFLPLIAMVVAANLSNVVLLPRLGPKPLVTAGRGSSAPASSARSSS